MALKISRRTLLAGTASAALLAATGPALAQSAADRAVEAAKQYAGTTLNVFYEAGLQPLDPKNFTGPMWEELTGIKINVIESPIDQMFSGGHLPHLEPDRGVVGRDDGSAAGR